MSGSIPQAISQARGWCLRVTRCRSSRARSAPMAHDSQPEASTEPPGCGTRRRGDLIFTSPVEPSDVAAVAFTPNGLGVTAVYSDGRIVVYPIALEDAVEIARARTTRGFTDEDCRRYLHVPSCPAD